MTNIEAFNLAVGLIFEQLYSSFPVAQEIDQEPIARALGLEVYDNSASDGFGPKILNYSTLPSGQGFFGFFDNTMNWLVEEGYLRRHADSRLTYTLSARALTVLSSSPASLEPKLGERLQDAAKSVGSEAGRSALGQVVGEVIGATFKSFLG